MSHFIGLVFVNTVETDLDTMLEPFDEQTEDQRYIEFVDCTDEVREIFDKLPDKDERLDSEGNPWKYPRDREHYPTIESLAEDWFGYRKNSDGIYGYTCNPNAKWDWYAIGNRWNGYLLDKNGHEYNQMPFDDVDWVNMFVPREDSDWNRIPFCLVTTEGEWHERGDMGWWAVVSDEKDEDTWGGEVNSYVASLLELPEEERKNIVVYAVDFHI